MSVFTDINKWLKPRMQSTCRYFVIDSIGGLYPTYSDTTCRMIEDVRPNATPIDDVMKYIDQWKRDRYDHYHVEFDIHISFTEEVSDHGDYYRCWVKFPEHMSMAHQVEFGDNYTDYQDALDECPCLFIQAHRGVMTGSGVVVYNQAEDMVQSICSTRDVLYKVQEIFRRYATRIKNMPYDYGNPETKVDFMYHAFTEYRECVSSLTGAGLLAPYFLEIDDDVLHLFPITGMPHVEFNEYFETYA